MESGGKMKGKKKAKKKKGNLKEMKKKGKIQERKRKESKEWKVLLYKVLGSQS